MDAMAAARKGWVNFEPAVDLDDLSGAGGGFFGMFSGRGPEVALATWTPPTAPRRGRGERAMIGLQHGAGRRIKTQLADAGHAVPDGWIVVQDYVRKGLVISVPPGVAHADVLVGCSARPGRRRRPHRAHVAGVRLRRLTVVRALAAHARRPARPGTAITRATISRNRRALITSP